MAKNVIRRSISLEERDDETVLRIADLVGGFSAALRMIIRQWAEWEPIMAEQRVRITEAGKAALAEEDCIDLG